jgi:thioesterase DpgC
MNDATPDVTPLRAAGLSETDISAWQAARPSGTGYFSEDRVRFSDFWNRSGMFLSALPAKPRRSVAEQKAADVLVSAGRETRETFLTAHAVELYDELTGERTKFLRLDALCAATADAVRGLVPSLKQLSPEASQKQADKDGLEVDQGIFLAHVLAHEASGNHLCHAMILPKPESSEALSRFAINGELDLGSVRLKRLGQAVHLTSNHPRFLNAEDNDTLALTEIAVDVAILDPETTIGVLRGGIVDHHKYRGRRVFGAGINLTRLYRGEIPFLWFLERDLGYVHKLFRGVASPDAIPDDIRGRATEKLWVAAVDTFAIGGHCQLLLAVDYVLAGSDAYMTLPARKEGIIPGFANLRLPRFVGDRLARQAIQYERRFNCDSPEGRLICDEIAATDAMDEGIKRVVNGLTSSGSVSAIGNRRAFRIGQEPLDLFRRYASLYAREQAYCHFSPALIANLERHWNAAERKV